MDTDIILDRDSGAALDAASCYRALAAKDTRFDGVFFTGVKTTGIYCRPVCGVKTPRASSCVFFNSAAAAEAAGFRPCLRCRPELAPYALQQNLAHAVWQRIAAGALNDGDTEGLADKVGLSSRQLRRVLLQHFGVTPIELAQTQRLLFAKKLLQETQLAMSDIAFASGFGSVRRFNALFLARYGMAPGAIRRATEATREPAQDALTLRLAYRPPFAWSQMLAYLSVRAIPGVEAVAAHDDGTPCYVRSVRLAEESGWLRVRQLPQRHQLELSVPNTLAHMLMPLVARVRQQFDLDANPEVIAAHLSADPLLARQIGSAPGLRVPGAFDVFELAIRTVLGQQISVRGATTLSGRMAQAFGDAIDTPFAGVTYLFPAPQRLAGVHAQDIVAIGMPASCAEAIRNLALFSAQGGLDMAPGTPLDAAVARLRAVRGIGEWTAQYIAMRALRFPDAFPAGDLGLQKAAVEAKGGTRLTERQLLVRAAHWSPWRAYAALLLWHSLN